MHSLGLHIAEEPDYFYDEDFTVQFDSNIRDLSPAGVAVDPAVLLGLPHISAGSYLSFNDDKGDMFVNHPSQEVFCPEESELSYSRNSAMDMSTSEREMMCSSDMLDFSDNPLFSPSPTHEHKHQLPAANVMTDSLDKVKVPPPSSLQVAGQHPDELSSSRASSSEGGHLCMNCSPRKDAYHLSFIGSLGSNKGSCSDIENSLTSMDSSQGQGHSEDGDECSDSFHFTYPGSHGHHGTYPGSYGNHGKCRVSRGRKFNKSLGSVPENSLEQIINKDILNSEDLQSTIKEKQDSEIYYSANTFPRVVSPQKKHLTLNTTLNSPRSNKQKTKKVMSWRQVKSLRKLGKLENVFDPSRSASMPELCVHQTWQSLSSRDLHKIAESFHNKHHSAYLLDLYQRVKDDHSNPTSPDTMANIEQILFHPAINHNTHHQGTQSGPHHSNLDSNSDHTITNSHAPFSSHGQGQSLDHSTRRRIIDWLQKEKFDGAIKSKGKMR